MNEANPALGNDPLAPRMAWLAFFSTTCAVSCSVGPFSVLLPAAEGRLGIDRGASSLALGLMMICAALMAPIVGSQVNRFSLRRMLVGGALTGAVGFVILALTHSVIAYYLAYGLFVGPAMSLNAQVLPSTLVTRWYRNGRGRVLGLINVPVLLVLMPIAASLVLGRYGPQAVYLMLAGIMLLCAAASLLVIDAPASSAGGADDVATAQADLAHGGQILANGDFWVLVVPLGLLFAGSTVMSAHMVPMAMKWGLTSVQAASLMSFAPLSAMAGAPLFGWLADRIGGAATLGLCCLVSGLFWASLLLEPSYIALVIVNLSLGAMAAAGLPAFAIAAAHTLGQENFGRVYGMGAMVATLFTVPIVPLAGVAYVKTGSYAATIIALAVVLTVSALVTLGVSRRKPAPAPC